MAISKDELKRIIMSILIGAGVAFLTKLLEGIFDLINNWLLDLSGPVTSMIYYLKKTDYTRIV